MKPQLPLKGSDEYDAFTTWRRVLYWQRGELRRIKQHYNRRVRRWWRRLCKKGIDTDSEKMI